MKVKFLIDFENFDKNGKRYNKKTFEANSLVKGFLYILFCENKNASVYIVDTSSSSQYIDGSLNVFNITAPINNSLYGIVVGSNNTAVSISDNKLNTQISHGTGAGQLSHQAVDFPEAVNVSGSDCRFQIHRDFINNSGGSITIQEIGLYSKSYYSKYICFDRTLSSKTIPNTEGASVTYTMLISV